MAKVHLFISSFSPSLRLRPTSDPCAFFYFSLSRGTLFYPLPPFRDRSDLALLSVAFLHSSLSHFCMFSFVYSRSLGSRSLRILSLLFSFWLSRPRFLIHPVISAFFIFVIESEFFQPKTRKIFSQIKSSIEEEDIGRKKINNAGETFN